MRHDKTSSRQIISKTTFYKTSPASYFGYFLWVLAVHILILHSTPRKRVLFFGQYFRGTQANQHLDKLVHTSLSKALESSQLKQGLQFHKNQNCLRKQSNFTKTTTQRRERERKKNKDTQGKKFSQARTMRKWKDTPNFLSFQLSTTKVSNFGCWKVKFLCLRSIVVYKATSLLRILDQNTHTLPSKHPQQPSATSLLNPPSFSNELGFVN